MFKKYAMTDKEKCLLSEYLGTGLTPRQIRTLKGQCRAGDIDGAMKGLHRILRRM